MPAVQKKIGLDQRLMRQAKEAADKYEKEELEENECCSPCSIQV